MAIGIIQDAQTQAINQYLANQAAMAAAPTVTATNSTVSNMDAASLQALQKLIASLGAQQAASQATTQQAATTAKKGAEGYSKEAAFADSAAAVNAQMRAALLELMPSIVRAAEGAGTSQSSMRALLTQDAAQKAADSAAQLGIKAAVDYGQLQQGLLNSLANLNQTGDATTNALINALQVAKGAQVTTKAVQSQGKDANYTSVSGVMGGANQPITTPGWGVTGSYGNAWSNYSF